MNLCHLLAILGSCSIGVNDPLWGEVATGPWGSLRACNVLFFLSGDAGMILQAKGSLEILADPQSYASECGYSSWHYATPPCTGDSALRAGDMPITATPRPHQQASGRARKHSDLEDSSDSKHGNRNQTCAALLSRLTPYANAISPLLMHKDQTFVERLVPRSLLGSKLASTLC